MARPTKYTDTRHRNIIAMVKTGVTETAAAEANGIHRDTLCTWKRLGEQGDPRYTAFLDDLTRARASAEVTLTKVVMNAAFKGGDWKAALEVLARRNPEDWGRKDMVESRVDKKLQEILEVIKTQVSEDAYTQFATAICAERGMDPADVLGTRKADSQAN